MKRWLLGILAGLLVLAVVSGGWLAYQHSYDLREERVEIGDLRGVLALPKTGDRHGLVVFVHGDGPIDATHDTWYRPIWEALARGGYASLSLDKPGVAGAPGNWLHQTMADRQQETLNAIGWAKGRSDIDPNRIGLWGASQAGWVMPAVTRSPDVKFMIAVGPAVNWLEQGRYDLLTDLSARGASAEETAAELARSDATRDHLRRKSTYEQFKAEFPNTDITADRWRFIQANFESDASADLAQVKVPTLLILGDKDAEVDVADTDRGYRRFVQRLEVKHYPGGTHGITYADRGEFATNVIGLFAPRSLFVDGYLDDMRRFVAGIR